MIQILRFILLFSCTFQVLGSSFYRLSNKQNPILTASDYLYSTLGYFRLELISDSCQFRIQSFQNNKYISKGLYPKKKMNSPCDYVRITENYLSTSFGKPILEIQSAEISQLSQIIFTIDDLGVIRLILSNPHRNKVANDQVWISDFRSPKKYLYTTTNIIVSLEDTLSFRTNQGGWGFSAFHGEFRIFSARKTQKIVRYKYNSFSITPNEFLDKDNYSPPRATFEGLNYQAKCGVSEQLNFKFPIVFVVNPIWPELRVLDQGGYEILKVRYPNYNCENDLGIDHVEGQSSCYNWFCPPETFQFQGKCIRDCPYPFFHQVKINKENRCVLRCEEGSVIDPQKRICTCRNQNYPICLNQTKSYVLGCFCTSKNQYFDGKKCSKNCPALYTKYDDMGICISCPYKCFSCEQSRDSVNFVKCFRCLEGYELFQGICRTKCQHNCFDCDVQNCENCQRKNKNACQKCENPFILFEKSCIRNCPQGYILKNTENGFICDQISQCSALIHNNQSQINSCKKCGSFLFFCWTDCQDNTFFRNESECFCRNSEEYAYVEHCKPKQNYCPYQQYLNPYNECLPCPFGCLTCLQDYGGFIQCTSCAPAYFLILDLQWGHYCQRNTLLTECSTNSIIKRFFDPNQMICDFGEEKQNYSFRKTRLECRMNDAHCLTCLQRSLTQCSYCQKGYYLYKNKCFKQCPQQTLQYQRSCFDILIDNCKSAKIIPSFYFFNIEMETQFMEGYKYFLPNNQAGKNERIDPVGAIFFYSFLSNKNLSGSRQGKFDEGKLVCTQCEDSYGLNLQGSCSECFQPQCIICPNSFQRRCSLCQSDYKLDQSHQWCIPKLPQQIECKQNEWKWQDRICHSSCYGYYKKNEQINCSRVCEQGLKIKKQNQSEDYLLCSAENKIVDEEYLYLIGTFYKINKSNWIIFVIPEDHKFVFSDSVQQPKSSFIITEPILLGLQSAQVKNNIKQPVKIVEDDVIVLIPDSQYQALSIQLKPGKLVTSQRYLANSNYAVSTNDQTYQQLLDNSLVYYGTIYSIILIMITVIFIGDGQLYKTDNAVIYFQFLYISLLSMNLSSGNKELYRFLYGFKFIVGHIFNINWGSLSLDGGIYVERAPTSAHYLLNIDNNAIRNLAFLFIFILVYGLLMLIIHAIIQIGLVPNRIPENVKHMKQLKSSYIYIMENSVLIITYYSISNLKSPSWPLSEGKSFYMYKIISSLLIFIIVVASIFRFISNKVAGIYLFKRILLATFMATFPHLFYLLVAPQILFTIGRLFYDQIQIRNNPYIKFIIIEEFLIMLAYVMMQIHIYVPELTLGYTSTVAHIYLAVFIIQLILKVAELHKLSPLFKLSEKKTVNTQKIRKLWDHDVCNTNDTNIDIQIQ